MEQNITKPAKKGVFISLILIVFTLILFFTKQMQNQILSYVQYVIFGIGIIWACISFANQTKGNVTFGNIFSHGFKTTAAVTAIMIVFGFILVKVAPSIVDEYVQMVKQKLISEAKNPLDEINKTVEQIKQHYAIMKMTSDVFGYAILGAVFSLIGSAVAKKDPNYQPLQ